MASSLTPEWGDISPRTSGSGFLLPGQSDLPLSFISGREGAEKASGFSGYVYKQDRLNKDKHLAEFLALDAARRV